MAPNAPAASEASKRIYAASVRVEWRPGTVMVQCGSGVIVDVDPVRQVALVVTCKHVLPTGPAAKRNAVYQMRDTSTPALYAGESPIRVYHPSGKQWYATWLAAAVHDDLAACMIDTSKQPVEPTTLASVAPGPGKLVLQAGYPGGRWTLNSRTGTVSGKGGVAGRSPVWLLNMACQSGDSGSGVFDANGNLVAILWGGAGQETCCTGLGELRAFVEHCHRWVRPGRPGQQPQQPRQPTQPPSLPPPILPPPIESPPIQPPAMPPAGPDLSAVLAAIADLRQDVADLRKLAPKNGKDGKDGLPGRDGKDGIDGRDGKPGVDGKPGRDGKDADAEQIKQLENRIAELEKARNSGPAFFEIVPRKKQ